VPGVHAAHAPLTQNGVLPVHADELDHCPVASHVCTLVPEHWVAPGVHTPVHAPSLHTYGHAIGLPQRPPLHICTPLPEHCVSFVVHALVEHAPALHVTAHAGVTPPSSSGVFCQVPVALHVCGWLPLHCVAPGVHTPEQLPPLQT